MVDYLKIIDYSKELKEDPRLKDHLVKVAKELSTQHKNDENYRQPSNDTNLSNLVILTGLPVIPQDKLAKLQGFLEQEVFPNRLKIPVPQFTFDLKDGTMHGMALLTFADQDAAKAAVEKLNGYQFTKDNTFSAIVNEEFDDIIGLDDNYTAPKVVAKEELQAWLLDSRFREQLLVRAQNRHYIQWFDHVTKTEPLISGNNFNAYGEVNKIEWSKSGSYLVTFHDGGFGLWGGKTLEQLNFYAHPMVQNVEFSSDENYVLSFNGTVNEAPNAENYIVWRVGTVQKLRSFKATQSETWGSFKWSFDSKFIASMGNDILNVYELPSMQRVEDPSNGRRTAIKVQNIQNISWSPSKNLLVVAAYKSAALSKSDNSGKIYVLEFPSRQNLKWKTITWDFTDCEIYWENTGYKVILVLKKTLKNKKYSYVVQVGDIKFSNITVEEHEFQDAKFVNVDETGKRVSVASQDPAQVQSAQGSGIVGYTVELFKTDEEVRGKYLQKLGTFTDKYISHVMWANNGTFFALVNVDKFSAKIGQLEFGLVKGNNLEIIKVTKFPYMTTASWDPSGRYMVTSSNKGQYTIWTAYGEAIIKDSFAEISQIAWRPKPRPIPTADSEEKLVANSKKYIKKYEDEDDRILNEDKYKKEKLRAEQKEAFLKLLVQKKKAWAETKAERVKLIGFDEDNLTDLALDEIVEGEEIVETKK